MGFSTCCCSQFASRFDRLSILICFSAHYMYTKQVKSVWLSSVCLLINKAFPSTQLPLTGSFFLHGTILETVVCENPWRWTVTEILSKEQPVWHQQSCHSLTHWDSNSDGWCEHCLKFQAHICRVFMHCTAVLWSAGVCNKVLTECMLSFEFRLIYNFPF